MGLRLEGEMTSSLGIDYRVQIYDGSYSGSTVTIPLNNIELQYMPSDDTLLSPIITSELTINLYDDGTSGIAAAITSIETSDEENIEVTVERDSGSGYALEWVGIVQKEGIVRYNISEPVEITLRATDGLNLLKDVRYPGIANGTHTGSSQLMQFITECLEENGLDSFWGASEPYIRESIEWSENQVVSPASDSPILYTRCDVLKFRNEPGGESTENKTCFEVIEGICNLFGAQFFHANGCYYLRQPRNYDGTSHTERRLSKGLTELSSATVSNDAITTSSLPSADQVRVLGGGAYMLREPLDIVRADIKPGYLLPMEHSDDYRIGWIDTGGGSTVNDKDHTFTVPLGTVVASTSPPARLRILQELNIGGKRWEFKITYTINLGIGAYYLDWDSATNTFSWSASSASYIDFKPTRGNNGDYNIGLITPPIPNGTYTNSTLTCRIEFWDRGTGAQPSDIDIINAKNYILLKQPQVELESGGEEFDWDFEVNIQNPQSNDNSKVLDLEEVWFNDTAVVSTKSMFEVNTTGSTWAVSGTWDAGYDTDVNLSMTHLYERMSFQIHPVRMYRGTIEGFYRPHLSWIYDGETFVMRRLTHSFKMDEYNGDWWKINQAVSGVTLGDKLPKDIPTIYRRNRGTRKDDRDRDRFYKLQRIGENSVTIDQGDTITEFVLLRQVGHENIRDNDTIGIVHPLTGEVLQEFTVDGDVGASDTSISVDSGTADYDYDIGFYIVLMQWETKSADVMRGASFRVREQSAGSTVANRAMFESSDSGQLSYKDSSGNVAPLGEMYTETALSQSQIQSLNATPVQVVAAPGSGYYIAVQRVLLFYDHNGTEYTGPTGGQIDIDYASSSTTAAYDLNDIFLETADYTGNFILTTPATEAGMGDTSNLDNSALQISSTVAYSGSGGAATVKVWYKIIAI